MQKPNVQDLGRVAGWTVGTAGILFAVGMVKMPMDLLLTPTAIMLMFAVGFAVSVIDLIIVLRNPERLAVARGEKMPSATSIQQFREGARRFANFYLGLAVLGCVAAITALAAFAVMQ